MSKPNQPKMLAPPKLAFAVITLLPGVIHYTNALSTLPAARTVLGLIACVAMGVLLSEHLNIWTPNATPSRQMEGATNHTDLEEPRESDHS